MARRITLHCMVVPSLFCWAIVCKTVRPILSVLAIGPLSCLSCLSVCNVRALWPNDWTDQDETWHAGRPRPWPHCVRWGTQLPLPQRGTAPQFSAHISCGKMVAWIKMPFGTELGLGPRDFGLDGDPALPPQKGADEPPIFGPCLYCGQTAGWIKIPLGMKIGLVPGHIVLYGDPAPSQKRGHSPPLQKLRPIGRSFWRGGFGP